ncbi:MAG: sodium:solute symporter [Eubacteriales bacterium]|nr:sodium:solute symporter [Eubacteriales bacterium]
MVIGDSGFTIIDLIILIGYLLAVLIAGVLFSKKDMKGKEFFKGDGTIPWWVTSVSIFATLLSPISFLSLVGNSYAGTWLLWFAQLGMIIAIPITIKFFLPIYSRLDIDTAYHYLEIRFGSKGLRILGAIMFIIYQIGRMSIIMFLPCSVLSSLMGINVNILIIIMGVIAIIYSYTGGLKSVLWTDFIQGAVLIVGVVFALIYLITGIDGGFGTILDQLTNNGRFLAPDQPIFDINILKQSVFIIVVGAGFNTFASYVSSQDIVQRFTTTTDTKKLNKMMLTNGALSIFIATVFYLIGTGLSIFYTKNPLSVEVPQDKIFAYYISVQLPIGITGILLAAIYAASQSTLSTGLNSVATSWALDIQPYLSKDMNDAKKTKLAQYISLGVGILTIVVAIFLANGDLKSAYETFNAFMGLVLGVLVGIFVLGAFTKKANAKGTAIAFIIASIVIIFIKYKVPSISSWSYAIISIAISLVVGTIASLLFKENKPLDERATIFFKK